MNLLIIISGIICIFALVTTIIIGVNPNDENYQKTTKKRFTLLGIIYIVAFIPAIILTIVAYYMFW
ncbi:hypothetical protein ACERII_20595 [Evansella sp. AB-rgal1]|uniref:hypothetical protein n=1 Tax=Evansella sp. AB-rgal1 TaxID=3242696 RepID=UPI00359D4709